MGVHKKSRNAGRGNADIRSILRRIYAIEAVLALVILASVAAIFYFHKRMEYNRDFFVDCLMRCRLRVTQAQLLCDEIIDHNDPAQRMDIFEDLVDESEKYFRIIQAKQDEADWFYAPFNEERVRRDLQEIREIVRIFRTTMQQPRRGQDKPSVNPVIHRRRKEVFAMFDNKMGKLESYLTGAINRETRTFRLSQKYITILALTAVVMLGVFLARDVRLCNRTEDSREHIIGSLEATNRELVGIVDTSSHDLRSPLLNIQGFANELQTDCDHLKAVLESAQMPDSVESQILSIIDEDIPQSLEFINLSAEKMDALLKGLLKLSRLGRAAMTVEPLYMNDIVGDIIKTMQFQIKECGIEVSVDRLPACMGDEGQVTQVFANLLDNAVKYLDKPGEGKIDISGKVDQGMSIYCVEDNGVGISSQHHEKIFQIFHRVDSTVSASGEGLGLTIVKRIVERHNGAVWVESDLGKGSRFYVALPHEEADVQYSGKTPQFKREV